MPRLAWAPLPWVLPPVRLVAVVAAEVAEHADRAVPAEADAHDRAAVDVVARVVEAEAQGVVAAEAAAEALEAGSRVRGPPLIGLLRAGQALVVAAEVAGEAQAAASSRRRGEM